MNATSAKARTIDQLHLHPLYGAVLKEIKQKIIAATNECHFHVVVESKNYGNLTLFKVIKCLEDMGYEVVKQSSSTLDNEVYHICW